MRIDEDGINVPDRLVIRDAITDEAAAIIDLQYRAYREEAERYHDWTMPPLTQTADDIVRQFDTHTILVAVLDSAIAGSVRAEVRDGTCAIGRLIVEPSLQNRGIGRALLDAIERRFAHAGQFELFTGNLSERNLHLYESHGYKRTREEPIHDTLTLIHLAKDGTGMKGNS